MDIWGTRRNRSSSFEVLDRDLTMTTLDGWIGEIQGLVSVRSLC